MGVAFLLLLIPFCLLEALMRRRLLYFHFPFAALAVGAFARDSNSTDARLKRAFRRPQQILMDLVHCRNSWWKSVTNTAIFWPLKSRTYWKVTILEQERDNKKDWKFFRDAGSRP